MNPLPETMSPVPQDPRGKILFIAIILAVGLIVQLAWAVVQTMRQAADLLPPVPGETRRDSGFQGFRDSSR